MNKEKLKEQLVKIIKEEIKKILKESIVSNMIPNQIEIRKVLQNLPVNAIAQIYGKTIFNLGGGKYIFPFPTENIVTGQDIASAIETQLKSVTKDSFNEDKKL